MNPLTVKSAASLPVTSIDATANGTIPGFTMVKSWTTPGPPTPGSPKFVPSTIEGVVSPSAIA